MKYSQNRVKDEAGQSPVDSARRKDKLRLNS